MADSYYQIATRPKLYISYPLFQYATGALDDMSIQDSYNNDRSDEDYIKLIQLDPSKQQQYQVDTETAVQIEQKIVPSFDDLTTGLCKFDFAMFLGHDFATANISINVSSLSGSLINTNLVNFNADSEPEFNGWSLVSLNNGDINDRKIIFEFSNTSVTATNFSLGSIAFGKSYTFPQNADITASTKFDYGLKQKTTASGKTLSNLNWSKPDNWITEPFGLGVQYGDNFQRRTGLRTWSVSFDSLAPDKVMPQNMMMNSIGYTAKDNHSIAANGTASLYNINDSEDFFSAVIHKSLGGHNPMVLQIDKDDYSPSGFAIVRLQNNYVVTQKTPNLYNIKCTFVEQI